MYLTVTRVQATPRARGQVAAGRGRSAVGPLAYMFRTTMLHALMPARQLLAGLSLLLAVSVAPAFAGTCTEDTDCEVSELTVLT